MGNVCFYSTYRLEGGKPVPSIIRLFTTSVGEVGQGYSDALTLAQTNFNYGRLFPKEGLYFAVSNIHVVAQGNSQDEVDFSAFANLYWEYNLESVNPLGPLRSRENEPGFRVNVPVSCVPVVPACFGTFAVQVHFYPQCEIFGVGERLWRPSKDLHLTVKLFGRWLEDTPRRPVPNALGFYDLQEEKE